VWVVGVRLVGRGVGLVRVVWVCVSSMGGLVSDVVMLGCGVSVVLGSSWVMSWFEVSSSC